MWTSALLLSLVFDQTKIKLPKIISSDAVIALFLILNFTIVIFNLPDAYRKDNESILGAEWVGQAADSDDWEGTCFQKFLPEKAA